MAKRAKLFERLKNNPKDATFAEIEKLLTGEGFILDRISGSTMYFVGVRSPSLFPCTANE